MTITTDEDTGKKGFSLLVVLLTILAIAAILTPIALGAKTRAIHTASLLRSDQLNFLSDGVATILASQLVAGSGNADIAMNSTRYRCTTDGVTIDYALQRHDGLINLNLSSKELLATGFQSLGFGPETAQDIAETVIAFRTSDQGRGPASSLGVRGGLKKAPIESIAELYDILRLGHVELQALMRTFTVNSTSPWIAVDQAPAQLRNRILDAGDFDSLPGPNVSDYSGAISVSVNISDGVSSGRFEAIFDVGGRTGRKPVILASWRHDLPAASGVTVDEGRCRNRFGPAFESTIAAMR